MARRRRRKRRNMRSIMKRLRKALLLLRVKKLFIRKKWRKLKKWKNLLKLLISRRMILN